MMKRLFTCLLLGIALQAAAQQAVLNKQRHFAKTVPAGNYSGITWMGGNRYAVADDKYPKAGFRLLDISIDSITGDISEVRADSFITSNQPNRDEEGICYVAHTNTLFLSGEADGQIIEYSLDGQLTGRRLNIPHLFCLNYQNGSFEALTYNAKTQRFWTTSENTLKADGLMPNITRKIANMVRLQSFGSDLQPREQYWYVTDSISAEGSDGKSTLGVCGMAALDDGQLIILEREVRQTSNYIGSYVHVKLYVVNPAMQQAADLLQKQLLTEFRTNINLTSRSFANYEGLCLGPRLSDGRQVLMLVADSQNQYRGVLKDWFKTIVLPDIHFTPVPGERADITGILTAARAEKYEKALTDYPCFLTPGEMPNHLEYLPAPPKPNSLAAQIDQQYYEWGKTQRNTPRGFQAALDEVQWTSRVFSPVVGFIIGAEECPEIFRLVEGTLKDAKNTNRIVKEYYKRTRPFVVYGEPTLVADSDSSYVGSYSYPSGHSIRGWVYALTLALVVPDSTEVLIRRAEEFALSRVICGRHYKSDIDAAQIEAAAVMSRLMSNRAFLDQLAKAREEYASILSRSSCH